MIFKQAQKVNYIGGDVVVDIKDGNPVEKYMNPVTGTYIWYVLASQDTYSYIIQHNAGVNVETINKFGKYMGNIDLSKLNTSLNYLIVTGDSLQPTETDEVAKAVEAAEIAEITKSIVGEEVNLLSAEYDKETVTDVHTDEEYTELTEVPREPQSISESRFAICDTKQVEEDYGQFITEYESVRISENESVNLPPNVVTYIRGLESLNNELNQKLLHYQTPKITEFS